MLKAVQFVDGSSAQGWILLDQQWTAVDACIKILDAAGKQEFEYILSRDLETQAFVDRGKQNPIPVAGAH